MWLRKKRNNPGPGPGLQIGGAQIKEQAAGWIANGIISVQVKLARKLSSWEKRCNQAQKKITLFLFCGIVSCYLFFSLGDALTKKTRQSEVIETAAGAMSVPPVLPDIPPIKKVDTLISPVPPFEKDK